MTVLDVALLRQQSYKDLNIAAAKSYQGGHCFFFMQGQRKIFIVASDYIVTDLHPNYMQCSV